MLDLSGCSELSVHSPLGKAFKPSSQQDQDSSRLPTRPLTSLINPGGNILTRPNDLKEDQKEFSLEKLTSLQTLNLAGCSRLQQLPGPTDSLTNLQTLDLSGCSQLEQLPYSIGKLTNLHTLNLAGCNQLESCHRQCMN